MEHQNPTYHPEPEFAIDRFVTRHLRLPNRVVKLNDDQFGRMLDRRMRLLTRLWQYTHREVK